MYVCMFVKLLRVQFVAKAKLNKKSLQTCRALKSCFFNYLWRVKKKIYIYINHCRVGGSMALHGLTYNYLIFI